ncbi:YopX protein [Campylobacter phage PC5]|uniref:YopX protein n=1 Tax=Campylobacter phage PC5 TaxID=1541690 RepID=A0A1B0XVK5_9CAUD|nr:YopX protein [Campylobacter phage PC5]
MNNKRKNNGTRRFTGYFDKNGNKIYKDDIIIFNDIVYNTDKIGVIIKRRHSGEFRLEFNKDDTLGLKILDESKLLVIGNIHENADLLVVNK